MKLLVGLGNPGSRYQNTRHNAGFIVLDQICRDFSLSWEGERFSSVMAKGLVFGFPSLLIKPQTFMNLSGKAVRQALGFYKITVEDLIVLHDDIDLPAGRVKSKAGGGHGGHNGIRSIVEEIGSSDFHRIKLGVGRPSDDLSVTDWVLGSLSRQELDDMLDSMSKEAELRLESLLKRAD